MGRKGLGSPIFSSLAFDGMVFMYSPEENTRKLLSLVLGNNVGFLCKGVGVDINGCKVKFFCFFFGEKT